MKPYILLVTALLSFAGGCAKLDVVPESAFTPSNFYANLDDATAAVSAAYDPLGTNEFYWQSMPSLQDQSTDDCEWGNGRNTSNTSKNEVDRYTFTPSTITFFQVWTRCYQGINRANAVIGRVPGITTGNEALKARLIGEATFARAFYYFSLVRLYGGVPLLTSETTELNNLTKPRASVEEVYAQLIGDLVAAETALPNKYTGSDIGRPTKGAAKALLAKVYLTRQEWSKASAKCKEVIDLGVYDLWANYSEVFLLANENGKESIFDVQAISGGLNEGSALQGYFRPNFDRAGFGDDPVTQNHYEAYPAGDKRRDVNVKLYTRTSTPAAPASIAYPCYVAKYLDPTATSNNDGANNFPVLRYADVLLMYAEALNEQGAGNADAYAAINRLRKRAGLADLSGLTQDRFRDAVLLERRLELAFEGHRWYDLVRTGRLVSAVKAQNPAIPVLPHHLLYPIPQTERDVNPLLTQNPGY